ncbi:alpha-hydroxy-acid oxidizing enzyme [Amylibacter kogurei]|uniref:Alpha-hydroxy-acid oxidizing enzyme n=1 Tax=Paramylibacter kogurei TaxID=1889778 RepID=A0A2G5K8N9_9RHOB|nr:alpha-hydroxy acid oxidase [Amylibacter kogurei]PIB25054.1 alpha-hydroxy-acid oxidizing enzyme [Amylibacter kogurei]
MDLENKYPSLDDIKRRAKSRLPHFAWEYVDSATGKEDQKHRNRTALDRILFHTKILQGEYTPDISTRFLGHDFATPFGIAPIGMSGMIWPNAEPILADKGREHNIPYSMSTVATLTPETIAPHLGEHAWFQFYPARDLEIRSDMIKRARAAGFTTLVLTVDVPMTSIRERQKRAQLTIPPRITPNMIWQSITHPTWAMGILKHGKPRLRFAEDYLKLGGKVSSTAHAGYVIRGMPDWDYLASLRDMWDGPMIVKGVTTPDDATRLAQTGIDAIWVSNHTGRQFDGGLDSISMLPPIRTALGPHFPVIFDSGVETGLDIIRAYALGADFVMLGRAFHYALAAFGATGIDHLINILRADIESNLAQMGAKNLKQASKMLALTENQPQIAPK